jgi:hypothetical protein
MGNIARIRYQFSLWKATILHGFFLRFARPARALGATVWFRAGDPVRGQPVA